MNDILNLRQLLTSANLRQLAAPILIVMILASIGVVLFRGSATSAQDLLKQAEMSLYAAKGAGRNTVRFFDPMIERGIRQRTALEVDLRRALAGFQRR